MNHQFRARKRFTLGILFCVLASAGCSGSTSGNTTNAPSAQTVQPASVQSGQATANAPHGPGQMFEQALATLSLDANQRTEIQNLVSQAQQRNASTRTARVNLLNTLASQVEQGKIDEAALQPQIDALKAAGQANKPPNVAAFQRLHDVLTPAQRSQLVDSMEAQWSQKKGERHGHGGGMHALAKDLNLTDDQKTQLRQIVGQNWHKGHDGQGDGDHHGNNGSSGGGRKAMLESFRGDTFNADQVASQHEGMRREFGEHMVHLLAQALPILTDTQRTTLAQKIRERAQND